ncbi:SSI family serine proteinase inhibitor [Actinokineospora sp. 24-640]
MPISRKAIAAFTALAAVLVAGPVAIASQHPEEEHAVLALTVTGRHGGMKAGTLRCGPDGGSHPNASAACEALTQVEGNLRLLNTEPNMVCTLEYDPVTATARGFWNGEMIDYREVFPNACAMKSYTGPVFTI